jgi:hypothetical protein
MQIVRPEGSIPRENQGINRTLFMPGFSMKSATHRFHQHVMHPVEEGLFVSGYSLFVFEVVDNSFQVGHCDVVVFHLSPPLSSHSLMNQIPNGREIVDQPHDDGILSIQSGIDCFIHSFFRVTEIS